MMLCSHMAALRSRYELKVEGVFLKALTILTATTGTGRAIGSLALVMMSGLLFDDK